MGATIQLRRGITADRLAVIPAMGEPCWDTEEQKLYIGDGVTAGGVEVGGDSGDLNAHISNTSNPHSVTKAQVGLGSVDNTNDADKPISTATQTALDGKQDALTGLTASVTELNILDGATLTTTELNYVDGVTSAIQTQIDARLSATVTSPAQHQVVEYNGSAFVNGRKITSGTTEPTSPTTGDIWLDTTS